MSSSSQAHPMHSPNIIHHMAALNRQYPPNSLEAIRACLDADAPFIEVDIVALADGDYLLVHDLTLEGETTGRGEVGVLAAAEADSLYLRERDGEPSPYHPARLREVVALFAQHANTTARLQLDFKNVLPLADDAPLAWLVEIVEPISEQVIVSSGADWQLRRLRHLAPNLELGFDIQFYLDWRSPGAPVDPRLPPYRQGAYGYWDDHPLATTRLQSTPEYLADRCAMLVLLVPDVTTFYIDHRLLVQSLDDGFSWATALHNYGIKLDAWTLDVGNPIAEANARRLLEAGVDQFTTNTPTALRALLSIV